MTTRRRTRILSIATHEGNRKVVFVVEMAAKSPNNFKTWRAKHWLSQKWERLLKGAAGFEPAAFDGNGGRVRVTIERLCARPQNFIRDPDNLAFCAKPVNDALKRAGIIPDDAMGWMDQPRPTQELAPDRKDWTRITVEAV